MDESRIRNDKQSRLKLVAGMMAIGFAVTLAIVVGNRLSDEALAVLAGAVCGVGAAIPTSLLIVVVSRRRDNPSEGSRRRTSATALTAAHPAYPPVVVVAPPSGSPYGRSWSGNDWRTLASSPMAAWPDGSMERRFTIVGAPPSGGSGGDW
ncbi:MAG TPA: hypothetical protein ENF52_00675 [Chloroflexi bacterium]|nr:hypothetical protein [Chloroflexota bacterium]